MKQEGIKYRSDLLKQGYWWMYDNINKLTGKTLASEKLKAGNNA